jgi:hypothetical protein
MLQALKTLPKPEILPPNSSKPAVGGIDNSTFKRLPGLKASSAVSKYKPPGLTFTVQPLWNFSAIEPTFRHDKPSVTDNRLNFRFSELFITVSPLNPVASPRGEFRLLFMTALQSTYQNK